MEDCRDVKPASGGARVEVVEEAVAGRGDLVDLDAHAEHVAQEEHQDDAHQHAGRPVATALTWGND